MNKYKCEYHDGLFHVEKMEEGEEVTSFWSVIHADTIEEAVREYMDCLGDF